MKARTLQALGGLSIVAALGLAAPMLAGATTGPVTVNAADSVTDYAGYPANEIENAECDESDVLGVTFQLNGGAPVEDMRDLGQLAVGDELRMNWTGNNPECDGEFVSVSLKAAKTAVFVPSDEQQLLTPYARATLNGQAGSAFLDLPTTPDCFYQADGTLGRPLFLVGDQANFYSGSMGLPVPRSDERSMLLGANNGAQLDCTAATTTTTVPEVTTTVPPTTAPPATTTPTTAPTLTVPTPEPTTTRPVITVRPQDDSATQITRTPARTTLAETGATSATPWLAGMSALLLAVGVILAGQGRCLARRSS